MFDEYLSQLSDELVEFENNYINPIKQRYQSLIDTYSAHPIVALRTAYASTNEFKQLKVSYEETLENKSRLDDAYIALEEALTAERDTMLEEIQAINRLITEAQEQQQALLERMKTSNG